MQEYACLMLRKAEDSGLFKFRKAERGEAICVAVTLLTCRHWRRAQTMKEMATIFNVPLKAINKAVKVCLQQEYTACAHVCMPPFCVPVFAGYDPMCACSCVRVTLHRSNGESTFEFGPLLPR